MKRSRRRPRIGDLVAITWQDIEHDSHGWRPIPDVLAEPSTIYRAAGYLARLSRRWCVIAPVVHGDDAFCSYRIPRGAIVRIRRVRG